MMPNVLVKFSVIRKFFVKFQHSFMEVEYGITAHFLSCLTIGK